MPNQGLATVMNTMIQVSLARAFYAIASLGIADKLAKKPMTLKELAKTTHTYPDHLGRLMRAVSAFGFFAIDHENRYTMTEAAKVFLADDEDTILDWILFAGSHWNILDYSVEVISEGTTGSELAYGKRLYDKLAENPSLESTFFRGMGHWTRRQAKQIVRSYNFSGLPNICDVGGGSGWLLFEILNRYPEANGTLFDRENMIKRAEEHVPSADVGARCSFVSGDFFKDVPIDRDAYMLKTILRDWNDENCATILRNCRDAMVSESRVLIVDAIAKERRTLLLDLQLMFLIGGKARTHEEYESLLDDCGLYIHHIYPVGITELQIIDARRR